MDAPGGKPLTQAQHSVSGATAAGHASNIGDVVAAGADLDSDNVGGPGVAGASNVGNVDLMGSSLYTNPAGPGDQSFDN